MHKLPVENWSESTSSSAISLAKQIDERNMASHSTEIANGNVRTPLIEISPSDTMNCCKLLHKLFSQRDIQIVGIWSKEDGRTLAERMRRISWMSLDSGLSNVFTYKL